MKEDVKEKETIKVNGVNWIDGGGQSNFYLDIDSTRIPITSEKAKELSDKSGIQFIVQFSDAYMQG